MTKTIVFIRHGNAEHNVGFEEYGHEAYYDEKYKYSQLTNKGEKETLDLKSKLKDLNFKFDLVLSSPLDRCIQTTNILFPHTNNIVSCDLMRENNYDHPCNGRRLKSELEILYPRIKFNIDEYDYNYLKNIDDVQERIDELHDYLDKNNFKTICVVSHHSFIKEYFHQIYNEKVLLNNCEYHIISKLD